MSIFWWILLIVLFSLPSLLGKKVKQDSRGAKHVFSEESTSDDDDFTELKDVMEELKRQFPGRSAEAAQPEAATPEQKQFLYEEYNPNASEQPKAEATKPEPVVLQNEAEAENTINFNLREAVIQSVIIENPYN